MRRAGTKALPEFVAGIPDDWSEENVIDLLLRPTPHFFEEPGGTYPAWEVAARAYGSPTLFRWWAGEKPKLNRG